MTVWTAVVQWVSDESFVESAERLARNGYDIIEMIREE